MVWYLKCVYHQAVFIIDLMIANDPFDAAEMHPQNTISAMEIIAA